MGSQVKAKEEHLLILMIFQNTKKRLLKVAARQLIPDHVVQTN
jgi:hypothetical protein